MGGNNKFIDKFSNVAMRVGGQIHLKALRDTFATIMPLYILAGVAVLINNVILSQFLGVCPFLGVSKNNSIGVLSLQMVH